MLPLLAFCMHHEVVYIVLVAKTMAVIQVFDIHPWCHIEITRRVIEMMVVTRFQSGE
jgi:hypothetical protein